MKRIILSMLCFVSLLANAQYGDVFEEHYNNQERTRFSLINYEYSNAGKHMHQYHSMISRSFIKMYKAKKDEIGQDVAIEMYLEEFLKLTNKTIERRDDNIQASIDDANIDVIQAVDEDEILSPANPGKHARYAWSGWHLKNDEWESSLLFSGTITLSMAEFAYLVKVEDPSLDSILLPEKFRSVTGTADYGPYYAVETYGDYAEYMKAMVNLTIRDYHDQFWYEDKGYYAHDETWPKKKEAPINYNTAFARPMAYMCAIYQAEGDYDSQYYYQYKITRIANRFKNDFMKYDGNGRMIWRYYEHFHKDTRFDDLPHAVFTFEFIYLCYKLSIAESDDHTKPLFQLGSMMALTKTFMNNIYQGPGVYSWSVNGVNEDGMDWGANSGNGYDDHPEYALALMGVLTFLTEFDCNVYDAIAAYYYDYANDPLAWWKHDGSHAIALANLVYYKDYSGLKRQNNVLVDQNLDGLEYGAGSDIAFGGLRTTLTNLTVNSSAVVEIYADESITFNSNTHITSENGADFYAYVAPWVGCGDAAGAGYHSRSRDVVGSNLLYGSLESELVKQGSAEKVEDEIVLNVEDGSPILVYPNPTNNLVTIEMPEIEEGTIVSIVNFSGQTLLSKIITEQKSVIDLSSFSDGIYIMNVKTETNSEVFKIVKN